MTRMIKSYYAPKLPTNILQGGNSNLILILYLVTRKLFPCFPLLLVIPYLYSHYPLTMSEVDYGYGEPEPNYGYGDEPAAETDYGYGDEPAAEADYGYGDAAPATDDYGYGDAAPVTDDYGYGNDEPTPLPKAAGRPKRRCSVTKFSLDSGPPPVAALEESAPEVDEKSTQKTASNASDDGEALDLVPVELGIPGKKKKTMMSKLRKRMSLAF
jgi:hypothetical protein